jgi:hypothetical protein
MGGIPSEDLVPTAPPVFVSWSHASDAGSILQDHTARRAADDAWRDQVYDFVVALRDFGIDAEVDLAHLSDREVDWTRFGPTLVRERDVIAVVNAAWRRAWDESGDGRSGRGAAAEVDVLHGLFNRGRDVFQGKLLLVLLPGSDSSDVPLGLERVPRVHVPAFDLEGMTELLRILSGQLVFPLPPVGQIPLLPPAANAVIQRRLDDDPVGGRHVTAHDHASATDSVTVELVRHGSGDATGDPNVTNLRDEIALLQSAIRRLPDPAPGEGPHLPWYRAGEQLGRQLAALERQLSALESTVSAASPSSSREVHQRLAFLLEEAGQFLEITDRCWLVLAAVRASPQALAPGNGVPVVTRQQRHDQLTRWSEVTGPPVPLDWHTDAIRRPGRVVFTGEAQRMQGPPARSTRWRVELLDDGSALVAAAVSGPPQTDGTGIIGWPGQRGETVFDAAVFLPVRRDLLETWILTAVELAIGQATHDGMPTDTLSMQVRLALPPQLSIRGVHNPQQLGVRMIEEYRNEEERRVGDRTIPGSFDLPLVSEPPASPAESVDLSALADPREAVRVAHRLARSLLEHFGVEEAKLLRADGTVDPFAAAEGDQQLVYQHARAIGLEVDPQSPADRRRRYDELIAQARAQLRPE